MRLPVGGSKSERLPCSVLPCHKGYNAGCNCVPDSVQCGGRKFHHNLSAACICTVYGGRDNSRDDTNGMLVGSRHGKRDRRINEEDVYLINLTD